MLSLIGAQNCLRMSPEDASGTAWEALERSEATFEASGVASGRLGGVSGRLWGAPGVPWERLGGLRGRHEESCGRFFGAPKRLWDWKVHKSKIN